MSRTRSKSSSGVNDWPLWKLMAVAVPTFGLFAAMIGFYPAFSPAALAVGIFLAIVAITVTAVGSGRKSWYYQVAYTFVWSAIFVAMGVRAWVTLLPNTWIWISLHVILYLAAWALPALAPGLSYYILREQTTPQTKVGRGCLGFSLSLLPAASGLGAAIGLYGPRYGLENWVFLFVGVVGSAVGLGFAQYFSHNLWQDRPWAQETAQAS